MANAGENTNASQFFICVNPTPFLDGKVSFWSNSAVCEPLPFIQHVVFGHVIEGMQVVKIMEKTGSPGGETKHKIVIKSCGEMESKKLTNPPPLRPAFPKRAQAGGCCSRC